MQSKTKQFFITDIPLNEIAYHSGAPNQVIFYTGKTNNLINNLNNLAPCTIILRF
jgi:hypothetical protein